MRASDADRERAVAALREHLLAGRLTLEEFTGRVDTDHQRTAVTVLAACGNVDIYVPEGVTVDVGGITVFGHRRDWGRDPGSQDAPAIYVRVLGLAATVDVWCVPRDMRDSSYREIIHALDGRRSQLPA